MIFFPAVYANEYERMEKIRKRRKEDDSIASKGERTERKKKERRIRLMLFPPSERETKLSLYERQWSDREGWGVGGGVGYMEMLVKYIIPAWQCNSLICLAPPAAALFCSRLYRLQPTSSTPAPFSSPNHHGFSVFPRHREPPGARGFVTHNCGGIRGLKPPPDRGSANARFLTAPREPERETERETPHDPLRSFLRSELHERSGEPNPLSFSIPSAFSFSLFLSLFSFLPTISTKTE